jgi:hypothetical protein
MSVDSVNVRILEPHGDLGQTQPLRCDSIPLGVVLFCLFMVCEPLEQNKIFLTSNVLALQVTTY